MRKSSVLKNIFGKFLMRGWESQNISKGVLGTNNQTAK